jgi:RHS repeat-associated protein
VTDAASHVTQYGYNTENDVTSITDASNHQSTIGMLEPHIPHYSSFPSGYMEYYNFDAFGNLSHINDRKGNDTYFWADFQDRQVHKSTGDGDTFYTYDAAGRLTQVQDGTGTYTFAYDGLGRLKTATTNYAFLTARNFTVSYTYDKASNRVTMTDPEGTVTTYGYDTLNRLTSLGNSWAGTFNFGYDALSRRTSLTRPNGVNTSYSYDGLSHLLSVAHQNGSTTLDGASYTYDAAGNRLSKTDLYANVTSAYAYDNIYQLTGVTQGTSTTESYTYDAVGNRLSSLGVSPYSYNSSNELTSTPSGSYTYDHDGNMLTRPDGAQFSWDYSSRLKQVVLPGSGGTVTFKYDPFGRRIQKSGPSGTVNYLYDGMNGIEEVDSGGNLLARYTQEPRWDGPLSMLRGSVTSYYEQDGLNSVASLTNSSGALAQSYTYDSYGKITASTGTLTNPFQYTGREFDPETQLNFYRARYYDQSSGRFLSEDPKQFAGGSVDFYDYVGNNPANMRDPEGQIPIWGWWCGPNWTGGTFAPYDPSKAGQYHKPWGDTDTACMHHDICYYECRRDHPCSREIELLA